VTVAREQLQNQNNQLVMENFIAHNPVMLYFGKGVVEQLEEAVSPSGRRALLVYGKGSVLKNGSYHDTLRQLEKAGITVVEFNGIKPNPVVDDVEAAARLGRKEQVDMVVAVGGGSVIDSAKIIGLCIANDLAAWDIMTGKAVPERTLPLFAILTLAATGTEMNPVSVLQNHTTGQKIGFRNPLMFPKASFLDPAYTESVPASYTAYGIVDLVAHAMEAWFGGEDAPLSDRFVVAIIKEALDIGPLLMNDLRNFEYRSRIMWAATNALNGMTIHGRGSGDWGVHALGHTLSYLFDTAHGATLSIMYPAWLTLQSNRIPERILELGGELFGALTVEDTIAGLTQFFSSLGSPVKASEAGIKKESMQEIIDLMNRNRVTGVYHRLNEADRARITELIL
jgi:alcohol dehydrogenase YqhD (iron-dependent ADH family)